MAVLTFLSDFGADSHYMASFRGAMHVANIDIPFIEISSRIEPFDIVEAAYLSSMVYRDFPENSIHILATNVVATSYRGHLIAKYNSHFFIAPDNGVLSLIFGEDFDDYHLITTDRFEPNIQDVYLPIISALRNANFQLDKVVEKSNAAVIKTRIHPVKDEKELRGTVIFVDHFGNAYTNISESEFRSFVEDQNFEIRLARHSSVNSVSKDFSDVKEGDPLCYFSDHGYLVASIKKSSAEQLLNLRKYKPIIIEKT